MSLCLGLISCEHRQALMSYDGSARLEVKRSTCAKPIGSNAGEMAEWLKAAVC